MTGLGVLISSWAFVIGILVGMALAVRFKMRW